MPAPNLNNGTTLNGLNRQYTLVRKLGEGGFGVVWLAKSGNQEYAIKILKMWQLERRDKENYRKRFDRAFKIMNTHCEHLVYSSDKGEVSDNPFYVMEYFPKGDMSDYLHAQRRSLIEITHYVQDHERNKQEYERIVAKYMYQALLGLRELHQMGLVHRDIKPENIMMRSDGGIALNDFDLAGDENNRFTVIVNGVPKQVFYTKAYAPPEQVVPHGKNLTVMPTIDIFAFGVMVYHLLTGLFPFGDVRSDSDYAKYYANMQNDAWNPNPLREFEKAAFWTKIIGQCIKSKPEQRVKNVGGLITFFESTFTDDILGKESIRQDSTQDPFYNMYELDIVYGCANITNGHLNRKDDTNIVTIGRRSDDVDNDIKISDDQYISRRHATLEWNGEQKKWYIYDGQFDQQKKVWVHSLNGTYVNSVPVGEDGIMLNANDIIYMGETRLKVNGYFNPHAFKPPMWT